jgi:hypothetical protein
MPDVLGCLIAPTIWAPAHRANARTATGWAVSPASPATSSATTRSTAASTSAIAWCSLDMAHYTMVKNTTFNGVRLPSIGIRHPGGEIEIVRRFGYEDFKNRLS